MRQRSVSKANPTLYDTANNLSDDIAMSKPNNLKTMGLKATLPRLRILSLFESSLVRHLSAEDVYRTLISEGEDIGLATVYRVLTQFEQAGLLERHHFEGGKAVFELSSSTHHDHLVCLQCGRVEEFYDAEIEKRQIKIAKDRGFALHEHSLSLYADCIKPACPHRKAEDGPGNAKS
jgi:Fur family transcriptional regulator, ferric uptake regulator